MQKTEGLSAMISATPPLPPPAQSLRPANEENSSNDRSGNHAPAPLAMGDGGAGRARGGRLLRLLRGRSRRRAPLHGRGRLPLAGVLRRPPALGSHGFGALARICGL